VAQVLIEKRQKLAEAKVEVKETGPWS
jgi:hypothetical protein